MSRTEITDVNQKIDINNLNPCGDFLLVELIEKYSTESGIIIPKGERSATRFAHVLRAGWGTDSPTDGRRFPMRYKIGDIVCFMDYAGERINIASGKYRMIRDHGIWARAEMDANENLTKILPENDTVVIDFPKEEKSLSGRMFLPGNIQTFCRVGNVVSVGPGVTHYRTGVTIPCEVKPGDRVIALRYSGANVFVGKKEYRLAQQTDIKGILEGEGEVDVIHSQQLAEAADAGAVRDETESRAQLSEFADRGIISREMIK